MKIKKGDTVMVIAGKDKGKTATVTEALPKSEQVILDGINIATRHQKARRSRSAGQVIKMSAPVHVSNVALLDGKKPVRVGYKVEKDGDKMKKVRVARPSGKTL